MSFEAQKVGVWLSCGIEVREGRLQGFVGDSEDIFSARGASKGAEAPEVEIPRGSECPGAPPNSQPPRGESVDTTVQKAYSRHSISAAERG